MSGMKKILLITLALIMALSLVSCKGQGETTDSDTKKTTPTESTNPKDPVTTDPVTTDERTEPTTPTTTDTTPVPPDTTPDTTNPLPPETAFLDVKETVYVWGTSVLNIRESYSADSKIVGEMKEGESVTRTGYNEKWSRISYYGKTCYASTAYLTTAAPLEYTAKSEKVYVTSEQLNLRTKASPNAEIVISLKNGDEIERTGVSKTKDENGNEWSRLLYNGVVCYANSAYLSTTPTGAKSLVFKDKNDTVYIIAESALNLRKDASGSATIVTSLGYGEKLTRTGIATEKDSDGILWSRVLWNDQVCYVSTGYLSEKPTVSFAEANEKVYVTADSLYMRSIPSLEGSKPRAMSKGTELTCIGKATVPDADGVTWYKVVYDNVTYYASATYLSPKKP